MVACALAAALRTRGEDIVALKPIETGCSPRPLDAIALAVACGDASPVDEPGFYRRGPPLAPRAVTLEGGEPLDYPRVLDATRRYLGREHVIIEGAGGLLVPLDASRTMADLALDLELPLLVVAVSALGVLSHTMTTLESAASRHLDVHAVVIRDPAAADCSMATNIDILRERLHVPVLRFPRVTGDLELRRAGEALLGEMFTRTQLCP